MLPSRLSSQPPPLALGRQEDGTILYASYFSNKEISKVKVKCLNSFFKSLVKTEKFFFEGGRPSTSRVYGEFSHNPVGKLQGNQV